MRPCSSATRRVANGPVRQHLEHRRRGLEVGLLRLVDHRIDDVALASLLELSIDELQHARARRLAAERRRDRTTAGRPLVEHAEIEIAVERERERSRNRRRRHQQHVRRLALRAERLALLHAESVLLVDRGEAELRERRRLLHQRMRADDERRLRRREPRGDRLSLARRQDFR